jgi:iron complex transport system substrate-binding protein
VRPLRIVSLLAAATLVVTLAACSTPPSASMTGESDEGGTFPVTLENAYGTTTIPAKPKRIATVAWANHEVPLALGIVPVGMSKATWGDDDGDGVLPWVEDRLKALGAKTPALFDETDGIDYEAVADTRPDVILAAYSGLSKEQYATLSKIAPVVAFPDVAWGTSMEDMISIEAKALGERKKGDALVGSLHSQLEESLAAHPNLDDRRILFAFIDPTDLSKIGFYTTHDPRAGFLAALGLPVPDAVKQESAKTKQFFVTVSAEHAQRFDDVDLIVTYGDPEGDLLQRLQADPLLSKVPAIARGSVLALTDSTPLAASANPSPLSIGWGIDRYFDALAGALKPAA